MAKLRPLVEDKLVKVTVELPAQLHRNLIAHVDYLNSQYVHFLWTGGESCRN
ncbi:DUF2274 domain-containing protein [Pannonibacter sp. Q-1]|jgi:hypothetical protein